MTEPGEQCRCLTTSGGSLREAEPGVLVAEEDVLGDRQSLDEVELLVHRGDAEVHGRLGVAQRDLLALPLDGALVGLVNAGQHLDQRALPRAVLTEEAVHLTAADVEVDPAESDHAGEPLDHAGHAQQGGVGFVSPSRCHGSHRGPLLSVGQAKVSIRLKKVD